MGLFLGEMQFIAGNYFKITCVGRKQQIDKVPRPVCLTIRGFEFYHVQAYKL